MNTLHYLQGAPDLVREKEAHNVCSSGWQEEVPVEVWPRHRGQAGAALHLRWRGLKGRSLSFAEYIFEGRQSV